MQLRKAERRSARMRMALQGASGSGKTYSALLLAYGLIDDWNKVAIIDAENRSADLYAHLGPYRVLQLEPPFSPERYGHAIEACEKAGAEVIILDTISPAWEFLLDFHGSLSGNSFTNWAKVTPRQRAFVDRMLQSPAHIIATLRVKQDYVLSEKNGKHVPEKVGLKAIQRDGVDYEFTIVLDLDIKHFARASKDRTGLFMGKPEFLITPDTGKAIRQWCASGTTIERVRKLVRAAPSVDELKRLFFRYREWYTHLEDDFRQRKADLTLSLNAQKR